MSKKIQRRKERELALWGLFRLDFDQDCDPGVKTILESFEDQEFVQDLNNTSGSYANEVLSAFTAHSEQIDEMIKPYLKKDWDIHRLPKIEKSVLRMAVTEMYFAPQPVPKEIEINEAIELTKKYGEDDGPKYVNGILNHLAQDHPQNTNE